MYAWQFKSTAGGIENNFYLPASGVPKPQITDNQILVEVYSAALNPADYKVPELGLISKAMVPSPCTPGMDFCGKIVSVGRKIHSYRAGQMVFGNYAGPLGHGSLSQYIAVSQEMLAHVPKGSKTDHMAGAAVAGLTAYQSIYPNVKRGDKIFINGGSGGTGMFGVQIAKALGCHVTTCCSTQKIDFCTELGADEVIDYSTMDVIATLKKKGEVFSLVVDNVGLPTNLYGSSHHFLLHHGKFVQVGAETNFMSAIGHARNMFLPGFLGGGSRKYQFLVLKPNHEQLKQIAEWIDQEKIKIFLDSVWEYDDVPRAFERLKTHRVKGKVIVHVKKGPSD